MCWFNSNIDGDSQKIFISLVEKHFMESLFLDTKRDPYVRVRA